MGDFGWSLFVALAFIVGYLFGRRNRPVIVHVPPLVHVHSQPVIQAQANAGKPPRKQGAQWMQAPVAPGPLKPQVIEVDFRGKKKKPSGPDDSGPKGAA